MTLFIKKIFFVSMMFSLLLTITSCISLSSLYKGAEPVNIEVKLKDGKPLWYWNPNMAGGTGGVGVSGIHVNGKTAQKELSIQRAIDDIAKQLGVQVSNVLKTESIADNNSSNTSMEVFSIQTTNGQTVKATIKEFWQDNKTNELYVWMVMQQ